MIARILVLLALMASTSCIHAVESPLDPLTWQEHWAVLEVLRDGGWLTADTRFSMVTLEEPDKEDVLAGRTTKREAYAVFRRGKENFEAVVDLRKRQAAVSRLESAQPNWTEEEYELYSDAIRQHPDFIAAMSRRGIDDLTLVDCESVPPGIPREGEEAGRRIGHVSCVLGGGTRNGWTRVIEGVTAVVDMDSGEVLRVVDEGVVPPSGITADFDPASIGAAREVPGPILVTQPNGPGFSLDGQVVHWQNWSFHVRTDQRAGIVISRASYRDGGESRSVLYRGNLTDIFVPYMDPGFAWSARTYLDTGEFSAGGILKPLIEGVDCPDHAHYLDALVANVNGRPEARPRLICLFEREAGDMAWRHHAPGASGGTYGRIRRDLVVRGAAEFGNYDYLFDWNFRQDGSITVRVGASGIVAVKTVDQTSADDGEAEAYGRLVDPGILAVNHDHFFNFRLDLDVDGRDNSLVIDRLVTQRLPDNHPRAGVWITESSVAKTEAEAQLDIRLERPALWRVVSSERQNPVGHPTSYRLTPGKTAVPLQPADDYSRQRAGFIDHHLWVTPYRPDELFAAGDFPTLGPPGEGLPHYTAANRVVVDTDIVLWHTVGMHHVVRAEDWPVMPVVWTEFEIRPFDFFDHNPALDLPR